MDNLVGCSKYLQQGLRTSDLADHCY